MYLPYPYYCVYTAQMMFFPSPLLLPYIKVTTLSLVDFQSARKMTSRLSGIAGDQESKTPKLYYWYQLVLFKFPSYNFLPWLSVKIV